MARPRGAYIEFFGGVAERVPGNEVELVREIAKSELSYYDQRKQPDRETTIQLGFFEG
jgi:predicted SnoaL-like aldol condensation-catalyzing enzyme